MPLLALVLLVAWLVIVAGVRGYVHARDTGAASIAFKDRPGSAQWWARVISSIGLLFAFAAPIGALAGLAPLAFLDAPIVAVSGIVLVVTGIALTVAAQWAMGASWRADVDESARTALVTTGPFRVVRNPILSATAVTAAGIALLVPNVLAAVMLMLVLVAHQIQVRLVEEPYLRRVHGDAYRAYGARTGRFVPLVGRFRPVARVDPTEGSGLDRDGRPRER